MLSRLSRIVLMVRKGGLAKATDFYHGALGLPLVRATEDWSDTRDESLVVAGFADGVWLRAPRVLSSDSAVSIGCDFRAVGGPFRAVSLLFSDAEFAGVTCHDFARS